MPTGHICLTNLVLRKIGQHSPTCRDKPTKLALATHADESNIPAALRGKPGEKTLTRPADKPTISYHSSPAGNRAAFPLLVGVNSVKLPL